MKLFKNFFKIFFSKIKDNKESFLYTKVIYNNLDNFIVLISFTKDYFADAIQFLSSVNCTCLNIKFVQSSYEEKDLNNNTIYHNRYYLLISGDDYDYNKLYYYMDSLNNSFALELKKDIINNRNMWYYSDTYFYKDIIKQKEYDKKINISYDTFSCSVDDIKLIKSNLPNCFTGQMLLKFIYLKISDENMNLYDWIEEAYNYNNITYKEYLNTIKNDILRLLCAHPNDYYLENWCGPQYLVDDDELVSYSGNLDDKYIDDLFKQDYDKFTAITSDDIEYIDIDEELSREEIYDDE